MATNQWSFVRATLFYMERRLRVGFYFVLWAAALEAQEALRRHSAVLSSNAPPPLLTLTRLLHLANKSATSETVATCARRDAARSCPKCGAPKRRSPRRLPLWDLHWKAGGSRELWPAAAAHPLQGMPLWPLSCWPAESTTGCRLLCSRPFARAWRAS